MKVRGMKFRDEDDCYEYFRQREVDDAVEASLADARIAGHKAGLASFGAAMNPYDHDSAEYRAWDKARLETIGARLAGRIAA